MSVDISAANLSGHTSSAKLHRNGRGLRQRALLQGWTSFFRDQRGSIAVETALIASTLVYLLLNGVDLGRYLYLRAQVENATQAGAHAVWKTCDPTKIPIEIKCNPDAKTAVINVASSFVGNVEEENVKLTDGYFCSDASGTLHTVSNPLSLPSACQTGITAGYYVQTRITYPYSPLFSNLTVAAMFASSISTTSHMRLQ